VARAMIMEKSRSVSAGSAGRITGSEAKGRAR
jgi:hypothetical protein